MKDNNESQVPVQEQKLRIGDLLVQHTSLTQHQLDEALDFQKESNLLIGDILLKKNYIHPHDLGQYLDSQGVAVRTGHHCAWPLTRKLGVPATTRASFYLYNTNADIDVLVDGIRSAQKYFG